MIPLGFTEGTKIDDGNYIIHLLGKGYKGTILQDLGIQLIFFPDCYQNPILKCGLEIN